jgi:hypothetical protein
MAGGFIGGGGAAAGRAELYEGKITGYFILACIVGSFGGSLFGYDLGVSSQYPFLFVSLVLVLLKCNSCPRYDDSLLIYIFYIMDSLSSLITGVWKGLTNDD